MENVKNKGLIRKYIISKADGTPVDDGAEYFVLRLDDGGSDPKHTAACRKAIVSYAKAIKNHLPKLSEDLLMMYDPKAYRPETFGQQNR